MEISYRQPVILASQSRSNFPEKVHEQGVTPDEMVAANQSFCIRLGGLSSRGEQVLRVYPVNIP